MKPNTVGREGGVTPHPSPHLFSTLETGCPATANLLTLDGEIPAEHLCQDDRVITRDSGTAILRGLRRVRIRTRAIRFPCGLVLPAAQPVLIRDWRAKAMFNRLQTLAKSEDLVDGEFIRDLGERHLDLIQLRFDRPHILYCGGLELSSEPLPADLRPAA